MYAVSIEDLIIEFELQNLTPEVNLVGCELTFAEVNRPALQLTGFFEYFDSHRIQIVGLVEYTYLKNKLEADRKFVLEKIFQSKIPCFVICRNLEPFPEIIQYGIKYNIPVLTTERSTTDFMGEVIKWLKVKLAPRMTMHGVLVDIYGEGILITGESGIGKSETALELIKRGHRLVADDAVEIKKVSEQTLIGSSPELIRHFIELRGIGIIDVKQMFGVECVKAIQNIDLVMQLEHWEKGKEYDRLGVDENYIDILGNRVICQMIPIRPGRNLAVICEAAAVNHRQKKMGYNAAKVLEERVLKNMTKNN